MNEALVGFVWKKKVVEVKASATSHVKQEAPEGPQIYNYTLSVAPDLPEGVKVRWKSIYSKEFLRDADDSVFDRKNQFLRLREGPQQFRASVRAHGPVGVEEGSIQFVETGKIEVLAEAFLPAYAPVAPSKEEKDH